MACFTAFERLVAWFLLMLSNKPFFLFLTLLSQASVFLFWKCQFKPKLPTTDVCTVSSPFSPQLMWMILCRTSVFYLGSHVRSPVYTWERPRLDCTTFWWKPAPVFIASCAPLLLRRASLVGIMIESECARFAEEYKEDYIIYLS